MEFKIVPSKSTEWIKDFLQPPHWGEFLLEASHWDFFIRERVSFWSRFDCTYYWWSVETVLSVYPARCWLDVIVCMVSANWSVGGWCQYLAASPRYSLLLSAALIRRRHLHDTVAHKRRKKRISFISFIDSC